MYLAFSLPKAEDFPKRFINFRAQRHLTHYSVPMMTELHCFCPEITCNPTNVEQELNHCATT